MDLGIEAAREAGQAMARHMRHQQQADYQVDEEEAKAVAGDVGKIGRRKHIHFFFLDNNPVICTS